MAARGPRRPRRGPTLLGALAVVGSYAAVRTGVVEPCDLAVRRGLERVRSQPAQRAVAVLTDLGSVYAVAGLSAALALSGRRAAGLDAAGAGLLAWTGAQVVKPALDRARPFETGAAERLVATPAGTSWPSGHAAVAAGVAAVVTPSLSPRSRAAVTATVVGIGLSRLYVGVHHSSDVVAGLGVGVLSGACWRLLRRP